MPLNRPDSGGFAARVASRFLDGLTQRYQKDEELGRQKDLLAQRGEQTQEAIDARAMAEKEMLKLRQAFDLGVRKDKQEFDTKTKEWVAEKQAEQQSAGIQERGAVDKELIKYRASFAQPKPEKEIDPYKYLKTAYGDGLELGQMREAVNIHKETGIDLDESVAQMVGDTTARYLIDNQMAPDFARYGKTGDDVFIKGDDLLLALGQEGITGPLLGFQPGGVYSAKQAVRMLVAAQPDPLSFAQEANNDPATMESITQAIYSLLANSSEPAPPKEGETRNVMGRSTSGDVGKVFSGIKNIQTEIPKSSRQLRR